VAILQSNYIPWKGYFHIIERVDEFILYDDVQYTRRDWRNRNKIKTPSGPKWITIPVHDEYASMNINEVATASNDWAERHWAAIEANYRTAPCFPEMAPPLRGMYERASREHRLSDINRLFLGGIAEILGITTKLTWSMDYAASGRKTDRLIDILTKAGAATYLSGPSAHNYIEEDKFREAGITLEWMSYDYPEYPQLYPPFEHGVSVLDMLFNLGGRAVDYITGTEGGCTKCP
jgi:hypothetical protein